MCESKGARIREQLGAWWAEEFPAVVMPTEVLIRLSERLAALSPVTRIYTTGSIDDGRDRRLPDRQTVTAEEEARGIVQECGHAFIVETALDGRASQRGACADCITTTLVKRSEEAYRLGELAEAAHHADCCVDRERLAHLEACLAAGEAAKTVLLGDALRAVVEAARMVAAHPEHKGGAWIGLLRDRLAALDSQP